MLRHGLEKKKRFTILSFHYEKLEEKKKSKLNPNKRKGNDKDKNRGC